MHGLTQRTRFFAVLILVVLPSVARGASLEFVEMQLEDKSQDIRIAAINKMRSPQFPSQDERVFNMLVRHMIDFPNLVRDSNSEEGHQAILVEEKVIGSVIASRIKNSKRAMRAYLRILKQTMKESPAYAFEEFDSVWEALFEAHAQPSLWALLTHPSLLIRAHVGGYLGVSDPAADDVTMPMFVAMLERGRSLPHFCFDRLGRLLVERSLTGTPIPSHYLKSLALGLLEVAGEFNNRIFLGEKLSRMDVEKFNVTLFTLSTIASQLRTSDQSTVEELSVKDAQFADSIAIEIQNINQKLLQSGDFDDDFLEEQIQNIRVAKGRSHKEDNLRSLEEFVDKWSSEDSTGTSKRLLAIDIATVLVVMEDNDEIRLALKYMKEKLSAGQIARVHEELKTRGNGPAFLSRLDGIEGCPGTFL